MEEIAGADDVIETLRGVEERLRETALRELARRGGRGDDEARPQGEPSMQEKRLQKARRGVERAIVALGGEPSD